SSHYVLHQDLHSFPTRRSSDLNQYGRATEVIWQDGDIGSIRESLYSSLTHQFQNRLNVEAYGQAQAVQVKNTHVAGSKLTYVPRSEEHTSELQSRENLVCRLLL